MLIKFRAMDREGYKPLNEFGSLLKAWHILLDARRKDNSQNKSYFIEQKEFPEED